MQIIGYTHSNGVALCPRHAGNGSMQDENSEDGFVQPVYDWDEHNGMVCEVDLEPLTDEDPYLAGKD